MTYGTQVTAENVDYVISVAKDWGLNLDYLKDNVEYNAEDGEETYVVMDGGFESEKPVTFTDMTGSGFRESWRFITDQGAPHVFRLIDKKL